MKNFKSERIFLLVLIMLVMGFVIGCGLFAKTYTLDVFVNEEDGGSVNIDPQEEEYVSGTEVELTAVAEEGWYFSEWQGDLSGSENPTELVMDSDKEVTAIFERLDYELTIDTEGEGEVEIIEVIEPQVGEYPYETVVKLRAVPGEGWDFSSWSGDMESSDPEISIIMDSDKSVTVEFGLKEEPSGFAGGEGTDEDPYLVGNAEQLNRIRDHLDKHFKQVGDIDLSVFSEGEGWETIGCSNGHFTGNFDGNGFIIQNLFINRPEEDNIGLFGIVGTDGELAGVALEYTDVTGESEVGSLVGNNSGSIENCYATGMVKSGIGEGDSFLHTGGLVGFSHHSGKIVNSYAKVSVSSISDSSGYVGGLVGANSGEILDSYATGNVEMTKKERGSSAGGLVGENRGLIKNSYASGNVVGNNSIGGLVGFMEEGSIANSHATGDVEGNNGVGGLLGVHYSLIVGDVSESYATGTVTGKEKVGGLIGESQQTIESSYAEGDVLGDEEVGGFVGCNLGVIKNSYSSGSVTGGIYVGGFAGNNDDNIVGAIKNSYAVGNVTGNSFVGGFLGYDGGGTITSSYWDKNATNQNESAGGEGRTTEQMKAGVPDIRLDENGDECDEGDLMYEDWHEQI